MRSLSARQPLGLLVGYCGMEIARRAAEQARISSIPTGFRLGCEVSPCWRMLGAIFCRQRFPAKWKPVRRRKRVERKATLTTRSAARPARKPEAAKENDHDVDGDRRGHA